MEAININQWNNIEVDDNEVEEISLQRKSVVVKHTSSSSSSSSSSDNHIEEKGGGLDFIESETKPKFELVIAERNAEMIIPQEKIDENDTNLPASDPPFEEDSTSLINVTNESDKVMIVKENGEERQEFYLENVFEKPPSHGFYCPSCNVCIQKVYIQRIYIQPMPQPETVRCSSCFSFLIPIGNWLFPGLVSNGEGELNNQDSLINQEVHQSVTNFQSSEQTFQVSSQHDTSKLVQSEETHKSVTTGTLKSVTKTVDESGKQTLQIIEDVVTHGPQKGQVVTKKKQFWSNWGVTGGTSSQASKTVTTENRDWKVISSSEIKNQTETVSAENSDWKVISSVSQTTLSKQPQTDFPGKEQTDFVEVKVDGASTGSGEEVVSSLTTPLLTHSNPIVETSSKKLEIVKSIVYGGLTESLASLSVVTSAASADAATLNIVALAIANLIGGLFALGHNLRELKAEQPKRSNTEAVVDRYNEVLGQRKNFILHAFIAILSFIIFGLIPPVVYGFTFRENDEKDFKLAAVAGASLICITLLSILKAYIKRPNSYLTYFQTVFFYVSTGGVATVLSYLAGDMMKKIIEKLGWFEPVSNFGLKHQPGFGSY
ncbi:membrane protein of ER body-like protein [Vicia villosa]|uniref:membrane protein of ER body-like protein n=1 Tax=Vicia villosa TaxID=3911 RepID=UPI00273C84A0|nr:membrane protein of ER body-like protein [Vicia villosa]